MKAEVAKVKTLLETHGHTVYGAGTVAIAPSFYFLFLEGVLIYIGSCKKLGSRITAHRQHARKFDAYLYVLCSSGEQALEQEKKYILYFQPSENKNLKSSICKRPNYYIIKQLKVGERLKSQSRPMYLNVTLAPKRFARRIDANGVIYVERIK